MNDAEHNEYMRLYKELVDRTIELEDRNVELVNRNVELEEIIGEMSNYIAKKFKKYSEICPYKNKVKARCTDKKCTKCVRDYFEKRCK